MCAIVGRKISCPVALAAVRMPETRPRRATNHRPTTVATSAIAIEPVPSPTMTPHSITSCHDAVMNTVSPLPAATISSAIDTTRRTPKRSISAAANGAVIPNRARLTDSAAEIVPIDQPNSARSGSIITLGRGPEGGGAEQREEGRGGRPPGGMDAAGGRGRRGGLRHALQLRKASPAADQWPESQHVQRIRP